MGGVTSESSHGTITSSVTGRVWLDRNLGASQACTSKTDSSCYGDYYQWGRDADGHEKSNSATTTAQAASINPSHGNFIIPLPNWTAADVDGSQRQSSWNPCPSGYRIPTKNELQAENISSDDNAFSKLKLPLAGLRDRSSGNLIYQGSGGRIWSSTPDNTYTWALSITANDVSTYIRSRSAGFSVRCIEQ